MSLLKNNMALALKYRPRLFKDLIGQESVSQTLSLALDSQKIGNAYLFSGLRGSGKTSSARIFARALQCDRGVSSSPCGECANCKASLEGRHLDIIEMDAASNRKIDDIRDLIEQTRYNPSMGRFKIFIIDEVHMLTKEAFNALLKTLEEPPESVKFILATTDPLLVPATILSRTQHFRFKKIPHKLVVNHIENILKQEGVSYEPEALEVIARSGEGSLRDTLTLLDQAILFGGNCVGKQSTISMLGIINPEILENFFVAILQRDENRLKEIVEMMREYECEMIVDEMMIFLKEKALSNSTPYPPLLLNRFFSILTQAKTLLALNSNSEFVLLLSVMKMQEALKLRDVSSYISALEKEVKIPEEITCTQASMPASTPANTPKIAQIPQATESVQAQELQEQVPSDTKEFETLKKRLYDRSYALGELFEKNFFFISYDSCQLVLRSQAVGEERDELAKAWKIIKGLIAECFAEGVNIIFQSSEQKQTPKEQGVKEPIASVQTAGDPVVNEPEKLVNEAVASELMLDVSSPQKENQPQTLQPQQPVQSQIQPQNFQAQNLQPQTPQPIAPQELPQIQPMESIQEERVAEVQEVAEIISQPTQEIQSVQSAQPAQSTQEIQSTQTMQENQDSQSIMQRNQELFHTLEQHFGANLSEVKIIDND